MAAGSCQTKRLKRNFGATPTCDIGQGQTLIAPDGVNFPDSVRTTGQSNSKCWCVDVKFFQGTAMWGGFLWSLIREMWRIHAPHTAGCALNIHGVRFERRQSHLINDVDTLYFCLCHNEICRAFRRSCVRRQLKLNLHHEFAFQFFMQMQAEPKICF